MSIHSSSHADIEKVCHPSDIQAASISPAIITLRSAQYVISITALVIAACALDRSLVSGKGSADEMLVIAAAILALFALPLSTHTSYSSSTLSTITDVITTFVLASAFVLSAVFQGKDLGSCEGPAMIGVFDNRRACKKMTGAVVLAAIDAVLFGVTAVVGWKKSKKY